MSAVVKFVKSGGTANMQEKSAVKYISFSFVSVHVAIIWRGEIEGIRPTKI